MIDRDIKAFVLRALLAAREPMTDDTLKAAIINAFQHVAFTAGDLTGYVKDCEAANWIAGTNDELLGLIWALTPKGKIRAQQLR
jgi:hypothetical protein